MIFGFLNKSDMNLVRIIIILLSKFYIYRTKLDSGVLNITALKNYLRENMYLEKQVYCNNKNFRKNPKHDGTHGQPYFLESTILTMAFYLINYTYLT